MEEVYRWVDQYGGNICRQLRRMGSSVDWSRQARCRIASACTPLDSHVTIQDPPGHLQSASVATALMLPISC